MPSSQSTRPSDGPQEQIPDTPIDLALLLNALRRLVVTWRERATASTEREARIYRQAEADLSALIAGHAEARTVWCAARTDLIEALLAALEQRDPEDERSHP